MDKDFAHIANDMITGIEALRQAAPDAMKAFAALRGYAAGARAICGAEREVVTAEPVPFAARGAHRQTNLPLSLFLSARGESGFDRADTNLSFGIATIDTLRQRPRGHAS